MDPATLGLLSLGISAAGAASSFLGGAKPAKSSMPTPAQSPQLDTSPSAGGKTSFLSNAAAAAPPAQTSGKSLLGQ